MYFTAEDAQNLIRNVNYEVPSLKKLAAKYEQQISDTERSIELCKKQSKNYQNEFSSSTKKMGIEVRAFDTIFVQAFFNFMLYVI